VDDGEIPDLVLPEYLDVVQPRGNFDSGRAVEILDSHAVEEQVAVRGFDGQLKGTGSLLVFDG
jgi:hypothetical protein